MIKLICFDFWDTIYKNQQRALKNNHIYNLVYNAFDKQIAVEQIKIVFDSFKKNQKVMQYSNLDKISAIENKFNIYLSDNIKTNLNSNISNTILKYLPRLYKGVSDFLKFCKSKNYKITLVSNTNFSYGSSMRIVMKNDNILNYFDKLYFSDETKIRKPNPKAFLNICKDFSIKPNECLFIGDSETRDIVGAKSQGLFTAKKCTTKNISEHSAADTKFVAFTELKEKIKKGDFYNEISQ